MTELIYGELHRFLSSSVPEVLCITGKWGVGKTYAWREALRDEAEKGLIKLSRYSYVSLFGLNSLEDLKYALFENTVVIDNRTIHKEKDGVATAADIERLARRSASFLKIIPALNSYLSNANKSFFLLVKDQIVCLDDLERAGKGLATKDVLGLAAFLCEQRRCKVVLLLNDEALDDTSSEDFKVQIEKVADVNLQYSPTSAEAGEIAFNSGSKSHAYLKSFCSDLDLVNIRVMNKIKRSAAKLEECLKPFDDDVLKRSLHSLVLFSWIIYQPNDAPPLNFLRSYNQFATLMKRNEEPSEIEKAWRPILMKYQFSSMDDLDALVLDGIKSGVFQLEQVKQEAKKINDQIRRTRLNTSFQDAWNQFYNSFDDDAEAVLSALDKSLRESVEIISASELNSTLNLLSDLGKSSEASELLQFYIAAKQGRPEFFDLDRMHFGHEINNPELRRAFAEQGKKIVREENLSDVLIRIGDRGGWSAEDTMFLSGESIEQYVTMLKQIKGQDLRVIIKCALDFGKDGNASHEMLKISENMTQALRRVAAESPINARRVRMYGVN